MWIAAAVCLGFVLDAIFGDPQGMWHPICAIGNFIARTEKFLRQKFPATPRGEGYAGICLWLIVCTLSCAIPAILLWIAAKIHFIVWFALQTLFCYQICARKSLWTESAKVQDKLEQKDLPGARTAVSYIVGRDTAALDEAGVTRAAVETVAENTSDGVIAPLLFLCIGGAPLGFLYKAVNTLDSMVGYKNDKYLYFGRFSAKLDDIWNYIPARLSAFCMMATAWCIGQDSKHAFTIWRRDRRKHASPNSAQTESVCAGALHIALAGNAIYFGKLYEKPTIGDADRQIEPQDIYRTNQLMTISSIFALILFSGIRVILALMY